MEGAQLGGMSLNVLPVSESENILTQDQMEADNAAVQSMEVSEVLGFYISCKSIFVLPGVNNIIEDMKERNIIL